MGKVLDFINNNAGVLSLITLVVTIVSQYAMNKSERRYKEKQENKKEKKLQYENKGEFIVDNKVNNDGTIPHIELIMTDFEVKLTKNKEDVDFFYSKDILNKKKYKHIVIYLKNIGKSDIKYLDICVTSQKHTMLCDKELISIYVKNKSVNYNYTFDRKVLKGDVIKLDIMYLPNSKIINLISSELEVIYEDSYGNLYAQPLFLQQKNIYSPRKITLKQYKSYITIDTAIKCFKNPLLW